MSTRRIPAALHRELSEYASLLRALRTRDTLDVTKHLTKSSPFDLTQASDDLHPSSEDEMDEMLDKLSKSNHFSSTLSSYTDDAPSSRSRSRSRDNGASCRKKHAPRDHWTRWPLMFDDVLEPEWTLEDEVAVVSSQVLRADVALSPQAALVNDSEEPEEDLVVLDMQLEDDDPDYAYYVPSLTCIISEYLSAILGQLASLTPPRPASMQNRIEPLNWQAVIDAVVSLGDPEFSNPKVLRNVTRRLEAIFGPSIEGGLSTSHRAIDRAEQIVALADRKRRQQEKLVASLFDQASPPNSFNSSGKGDDKEEREFVARRRHIAKGKRPEGRKDDNNVSDAHLQPRRSSRVNLNVQENPRH